MTIIRTAALLEAALIALLLVLLLLQIRRARAKGASASGDGASKPGLGASSPARRRFEFLPRTTGATWDYEAEGSPAGQPHPGESQRFRQSWRQGWRPIRARLAILSPGRVQRTAVCHEPRDGPQDARGDAQEAFRDATRALQHDESLRDMLALLPFAILMTNPRGQILLANAGAEKLFGYRRDELIGASADALVPGQQADTGAARLPRPVGGTRDQFARRKDGTEFPAEITTNDASFDGEPLLLTVVIDRTERYELQRNRQELAHLTRVSMLGELASSLAHELNQPLTAILSNAQAAQRFMSTQPTNLAEVREILQDLVEDNHRACEVIRRIRRLVKKGELEAAPLSLEHVISDVALLVHSDAIVRGIRVVLNTEPKLPYVQADSVQVQQVVLNLLLNAFHATESHPARDRVVVVGATREGADMVRVAVRDRGPGLSPDTLDQIFKPFFTSKREGLGLGLSISRTIVEMHGGRIWAENNSDQGATFCFTLPVAAKTEPAHSGEHP
ncbi:PAS domain-containing sensor histidine kinase [Cupriavidus sp. CV2]|uniref:sensor histidine kinase n=1 Tax=Cupriavidus ulmosensis TaxID=3065913 RepID=UPI00296B1880|nr:PAS domain-containing sensor histidine kinase [Cupriavidus sp. CV2]MDW3684308.1 PAS domain-containing sensor histidine kinase [Cupriavidus sp. CV2]